MAKTKYETIVEPNLVLIERWKRNGASDEDIAKNLHIAYSTFRLYIEQKSALSAVLKKGRELVDAEVENALLKRALGYEYTEITKERNAEGELVVTKTVRKQVIPDTTAQIFWLKNRRSTEWKDKHEVDGVEFKVEVPANIQKLTVDELRKIAGTPTAPSTAEFTDGSDVENK